MAAAAARPPAAPSTRNVCRAPCRGGPTGGHGAPAKRGGPSPGRCSRPAGGCSTGRTTASNSTASWGVDASKADLMTTMRRCASLGAHQARTSSQCQTLEHVVGAGILLFPCLRMPSPPSTPPWQDGPAMPLTCKHTRASHLSSRQERAPKPQTTPYMNPANNTKTKLIPPRLAKAIQFCPVPACNVRWRNTGET